MALRLPRCMRVCSAEVSGAEAQRILVDADSGVGCKRFVAHAALLAVAVTALARRLGGMLIAGCGGARFDWVWLVFFHFPYRSFQCLPLYIVHMNYILITRYGL